MFHRKQIPPADLAKKDPPGFQALLKLMMEKTKGQDEDEAYREIKRFHALFKSSRETYRDFIVV